VPPVSSDNGELSPWAAIVGPCYTVASFSRVLGVSPALVGEAAVELRVLRLRTVDGADLFPAFQVRDGHVHPHLQPVLEVLRSGIDDPWTWALWLNSPGSDGVVQMDELWEGHLAKVVRDAGHDAWAWRS
jgi:hypothetical protein